MKNLTKVAAILFAIFSSILFFFTTFAQLLPPGKSGNGPNADTSPGYGTNLWLSISLSNNAVDLLLHNTQPGVAYWIRSREDLFSGAWLSEGTVTGIIAAATTPATVSIGGRTHSLFLQACAWMTNGTAATPPMLAVGGERILELTINGDIISWGGNQYGELGDYTHLDSDDPVHVSGLAKVVTIAAGINHALAIDANGSLWSWGDNGFGQLGDGDVDGTNVPVGVSGMSNSVVGVAGGYNHSVAVKADGTVWAWGCNASGQLGHGNTSDTNLPVPVEGLTNAVAVAAGNNHTVALLGDGTVWAWGQNSFNQLGDGSMSSSFIPVSVPGLTGIAVICAGGNHSLALDTNGAVWAWGSYNLYGGSIMIRPPGVVGKYAQAQPEDNDHWPAMVAGLPKVVAIATGLSHSLAVDSEKRLWAWGQDWAGQLGDGRHDGGTDLPMRVAGMTNLVAIAAGSDASVALDGHGNLWRWGSGDSDNKPWAWGDEYGFPATAERYVDFYSGQLPNLEITSGDKQIPHAELEFAQPLVIRVTDTHGAALSNAPVSVEVAAGNMKLRTVRGGENYKGLRLRTDANGDVSLMGYADRHIIYTNGLVRILAASREQVVEADFNERLVPPPRINITSPADGSTYLIGTNQTFTITVDAQTAPGASVQEVDYDYQANGSGHAPFGISTQSPFSFTWTNVSWWMDAFHEQYTLTAVAVDDAGVRSDPQSVTITLALDSDGGGLPDYWQLQYFGQLGMDPNSTTDGNGHSLLYDYQNGIDPNVIAFKLSATNHYVSQTTVPLQINLQSGVPGYIAVMVNDTNLAAASWQSYTGSNVLISLGSSDGDHDVWIGLRRGVTNSPPIWQGITFTLDRVPPTLVVTNPVVNLVSQPVIQLQGYVTEPLESLTYDLINAAGQITNQPGFITGQYADTNLWKFTTNYFQCYDVPLTNGVNTLTLHATDLAGNTTTASFGVTLDYSGDTLPPVLTVVWPQDGMSIGGNTFTLRGVVDDETAHVAVSGLTTNPVYGLVQRDGQFWVANVPLTNGDNPLTVMATDAAGNSATNSITIFKSDVTLVINSISADDLKQSTVTVYGTISDASFPVWVNGREAVVHEDGTWEADRVPVNGGGIAVFDAVAHPTSAASSARMSLTTRSMDAGSGSGSDVNQSLVEVMPSLVRVASYQENYNDAQNVNSCGTTTSGSLTRTVVWTRGMGGFSRQSSTGWIGDCYSDVDWPTNWPNGETLGGESCVGGYSESPNPAWQYCSVNQTFPYSGDDDCGGIFHASYTLSRTAQTKIELVVGGQVHPRAQQMVRLTASAAEYSWLAVDMVGPMPAWFPMNVFDDPGDISLPVSAIRILGQMPMPRATNDNVGDLILTLPAGTVQDITPTVLYPLNQNYYSFDVQVTDVNLQLAVDNNRDGQISLDGSDATTQVNPYRFWINDSKEHGDDESEVGAVDQIPGSSSPNYYWNHAQGRSDYVNFFPVVLCLSNALQLLPPSNGFEYRLYQADGAVKIVYTDLTRSNAFDYLTNSAAPEDYGAIADYDPSFSSDSSGAITLTTLDQADVVQVTSSALGLVLNPHFLTQVQTNGGTGVILVEGCAPTTHPLMLEIWRDGKLLGGVPLYLSFGGVEQMLRHLNLCAYGNGSIEVASRYDAPNEPQTSDKNFVFLHGYNVNQQEARGVLSEMFKRMYWSGSKAKFYGVTWNGAESQIASVSFTPNYHTNVVNALQTAPHLASFLNGISGNTVVAAHSLGNLVALSAVSDCNVTHIAHYFMIDAAVPIEAIQGDAVPDSYMIYPDWIPYSNRLYASDWWQLFPANDARSTLTWSNRVGNLQNVDIYNYYSSGEEILRENTAGAPPSEVGVTAVNVGYWIQDIYTDNHLPIGSYGWQWQEMLKGRGESDTWIGSTHGGWRFSYYWRDSFGSPLSPLIMNDTPNSILQYEPMFSFPSSLNGQPDDDLLGADGSAYAQANRDRILSDAIPALTLPAGANFVSRIDDRAGEKRNFNMQDSFETSWPAARLNNSYENNNWHHSDFGYVAYPFTHKLFDIIVKVGGLK